MVKKRSGLTQRRKPLTYLAQQLDQLPAFSRGKLRHHRRLPAKVIGQDLVEVALAGRGEHHFHSATVLRMVNPRDQSVALQAIEEARHSGACDTNMIGQFAWASVICQGPELKGYENHKAPGRYFVTAEMGLQGRLQVGREPHQSEESLKSARIEGRILTSSRQKHILTGQLFWNMEVRGCRHGLDCKAPNDYRQERCIDR